MSRQRESQPEATACPVGLLERFVAVVRPEFRAEVLLPAPDDRILGAPPCRVAGCVHRQVQRALCHPHYRRWREQGRPDLERFVATTDPATLGRRPLVACSVPGCGYGRVTHGLCATHGRRWTYAGRPDLAAWVATLPPVTDRPQHTCRLSYCALWAQGNGPFCKGHAARWRQLGRPDVKEFAVRCETYGDQRFDFRPLAHRPQLKLELQYALQCRHDDGRIKTTPKTVGMLVRFVAASGVASLLDRPLAQWTSTYLQLHNPHSDTDRVLGFLRHAHARLEDLLVGHGWDSEFPRDVWILARLGFAARTHLRFDRIPQPWLRDLAKRWIRWRLSRGLSVTTVSHDLGAVSRFARFLASPSVGVAALSQLTREVLERYLAHLATDPRAARSRAKDVGAVNTFLRAIRQHGWDDTLPATAAFYPEDFPAFDYRLPRALAEHVMAQVEQPTNLDRWPSPDGRLVTLLLIRCGLRVGDATQLAFDCVVRDADGAPYLRYFNHKMKREALVPIDEELQREIAAQQRGVLERYPSGTPILFPQEKMNPAGGKPLPTGTYRDQLRRWLATCDIRDEQNRPVALTPHQWRHTFGTRLVNRDVPLEVVRVLLDHESLEMSSHYARLKDETIRKHWERARKVNVNGEAVRIEPDSPLADAQWVKHRVGLATQALPNGDCGLPIQRTCPHANACLTCPVFVTTPEFLDQHRAHREQTRRLLETANANGQLRLAEMNQRVLLSLDRIITALQASNDPQANLEAATDAG
jgi:integrase